MRDLRVTESRRMLMGIRRGQLMVQTLNILLAVGAVSDA